MTEHHTTGPNNRGFGCLGYGCIVAVVLFLLVIVSIVMGGRWALRNSVDLFTTEKPVAVPTLTIDDATRSAVAEKLALLGKLIEDPRSSGDVVLSQRDILGLLDSTPFKQSAFVELQGDAVAGTFSFPMTALGEWGASRWIIGDMLNRYVTGTAKARLQVDDGRAAITFENLTLNGQVFDGDALKEANEWVSGFVNGLKSDGTDKSFLDRVGSLRIQNGEALLRVRAE